MRSPYTRRVFLRRRVRRAIDLLGLAVRRRRDGRRVADGFDGAGAVPRRRAGAAGETRRIDSTERRT